MRLGFNRHGWLVAWVLGAVVLTAAACGTTTSSPPPTTGLPVLIQGDHHVPKGWKTYKYRGALISVPSGWSVEHNPICFEGSVPGTLILGLPEFTSCPSGTEIQFVTHVLLRSALPDGNTHRVTINGLPVLESELGDKAIRTWNLEVPAVGVFAEASSDLQDKIDLEVLETLRRAP
jgi:hypothetical protein